LNKEICFALKREHRFQINNNNNNNNKKKLKIETEEMWFEALESQNYIWKGTHAKIKINNIIVMNCLFF